MKNVEQKYLKLYAEPPLSIDGAMGGEWQNCVVIPARSENNFLIRLIDSLRISSRAKNVAIIVINGRQQDLSDNQTVWNSLSQRGALIDLSENARLVLDDKMDLILINRFNGKHQFGLKDGVGLARKIGCDLALSLIEKKRIFSPWIRSTDADVVAPENYFSDDHLPQSKFVSARVFSFHHRPSGDVWQQHAMTLYDEFLRYYVAGLKYAKSRYAFHSIGSTLCIHKTAYAHIRGFPKKLAGEDFYILNKLSKIGEIVEDQEIDIQIEGRLSERTPFGTGRSIRQIGATLAREEAYLTYDPSVFVRLKDFICSLEKWSAKNSPLQILDFDYLPAQLRESLTNLRHLDPLIQLSKSSPLAHRRLQAFHTYFDALKTLKLIHHLTERFYPKIPLSVAVGRLKSFN